MASWQSSLMKFMMRQQLRSMDRLNLRIWDEHTSITAFREYCERGAARAKLMTGVEAVAVKIPGLAEGLSAEWLQRTEPGKSAMVADALIFYCHGGGYISGSCSDHRALVSKLVAYTDIPLLLYEYRLAPEHPFPAALEDTLTAYRWLLTQIKPNARIVIAGDSAGAGLCLATLLALKDLVARGQDELQFPVAGICISPNTDMTLSGKPNPVRGSVEPVGMAHYCSKSYAGNYDPSHPYISPLFGDLYGLPPLMITVGDQEGGLDDSVRFAEKARAFGVDVTLMVGKGQLHCYPLLPDFIPESKQTMAAIASFIRQALAKPVLEVVVPAMDLSSTPC